jgi:hypothetical protein
MARNPGCLPQIYISFKECHVSGEQSGEKSCVVTGYPEFYIQRSSNNFHERVDREISTSQKNISEEPQKDLHEEW